MFFTRVAGHNFRLFREFEFSPAPGVNLILGPNAAGKTTLLEVLHALGRGKSFRAANAELAGPAEPAWTVSGRLETEGQPELNLGLGWSESGLQIRIDQVDASLQDLVRKTAVQVLEPDSHRLLEDGPVYRRRFVDWGVFHVEHRFFPAWRRFQRALKQRNLALRLAEERAAVEAWNAELAESGEEVHLHRAAHVQALREPLARQISALLGDLEWSLDLNRGWAADASLAESLAGNYDADRRQAMTLAGPHRAELKLRVAGRLAKGQASRGQQKLLIAALLLAQAELIRAATGRAPILLVDDFPAELGPPFQAALLRALQASAAQCFVTSIERTAALENVEKNAMFHVEHGAVSRASRV